MLPLIGYENPFKHRKILLNAPKCVWKIYEVENFKTTDFKGYRFPYNRIFRNRFFYLLFCRGRSFHSDRIEFRKPFATRQSIILEFAPTFISVIMAGKVGSYITSSIGTMRVTEQIDALEVMGINTYNYLIFPKIVALSLYPLVICLSMFLGIFGGYIACVYGGFSSSTEFVEGIQLDFIPFHITYAFIKTIFFSFILATVPSFHGYFMTGGALEVGKASTVSFVWTSVVIILLNYLITQLLLT